jgi:4,5-dihydroxyphthalate decarboxylase
LQDGRVRPEGIDLNVVALPVEETFYRQARYREFDVSEYQLTAVVCQRGILAEHHGVPVKSVRYFTGGMEQAGRVEKLKLNLPPEISVTPISPDQTLSGLLAAGELDAIYSAGEPVGFGTLPQIGRLFEDFQSAETAYFRA